MEYRKTVTRTVVLTISRPKAKLPITKRIEVTFDKGDTKAMVVKKAALKWLNYYINADFPESQKRNFDNYEIAKQKANVNIKGEVLNYRF